jgi:pimeloyl-ACP methyl ester carboxylesterase
MVGHSFGGLVALRHAIDHPDRVAAVALVDSFIPSPTGGAKPDGAAGGQGPRGADSGCIDIESMPAWERERRWSRESGGRRRRRRATGEQILLGGTTVLSDLRRDSKLDPVALAGLPMPVLCVMGSASPFRSEVEGLSRLLPPERCCFEVLGGGHALHLDAPTQLADVVTRFLSGQEPDHDRSVAAVGAGDHPSVGTSAQGGRHG